MSLISLIGISPMGPISLIGISPMSLISLIGISPIGPISLMGISLIGLISHNMPWRIRLIRLIWPILLGLSGLLGSFSLFIRPILISLIILVYYLLPFLFSHSTLARYISSRSPPPFTKSCFSRSMNFLSITSVWWISVIAMLATVSSLLAVMALR